MNERMPEEPKDTRVGHLQYDSLPSVAGPLATAGENTPESDEGYRYCVHGRTPLGAWCQQCNPLRR